MIDCLSALSRIDSLTLSSFSHGNTHPRALLYEKLSKYYLLSSPLWKDEIKDAWLWGDPKNPLNPPSCPRPDFGIDVVALGADGNFWSCQVKERSTSFSSLSLRDLSTFASASEYFSIPPSRRILFLFSSSLSSNSLFQTEDYKVVTEDSMEKEGIDFAPLFEEGALKEAKKENSRLRPYQVDAVEKCMEGFEKEDKGQLIMACGTGKTITGLSIAEQMAKRKEGPFFSLCLVPSIQLLTQTLLCWKKHSSLPFSAQAVCSDNGANGEENSPSYLEESNIPRVAKTAEDILSPQEEGFTSLFCTYPSLPKVIEAQKMGRIPAFDLCIADEAHRTTSKNLWGKIHFGGLRSEKTLFMTATPRLKEEGEGPSMDDSSFFGRPFFTYSFERAIKENYLSDYRVLLYAVRGGEKEEETAGKILASFDSFFTDPSDFQSVFGLEKVKAFSLPFSSSFKTPFVKRAIFFCRTIEESKKVSSHFEEVLKGKGLPLGKAEIKHIDGTEKATEKRRKIEWLKEGKEGKVRVLSNSRCLTEGIDVPSLEAVVFFDPKNSDVDVTQAVGRVIRHSDNKPFGLVVVPVVLGEKESIREAGRNKKYQGLIKILKKLREMDPSLDLALSTERVERKRKERKEEEEEEFSLEGLGEVLDKEIREEIPPSPIRFAFSRAFNLLNSFAEENPKEWEKAKERLSFLKEEKLKEEISLHLLLSPFFSSLALDPLFSFVESFVKKAFKDEKEVLKLQNPGKELRQKFSSFSPFYSFFLKEALGEEKGEEEDPSFSPQDLLSLLSLLLKRVKKEEGKDLKGSLFDPYSGDGSLLSFFEKEEKEKGEGNEERLIPYYMAKEKGLSCSLSDSFPKEKPSLLASNLLNFSYLKKEVEGGGNGEKELRQAFKRAKETLKEGGMALFISPCLPPGFPLDCLDGFSSLYSLSLRGSNGIRKPGAGENAMDERSSVSLLCLVKGEGELKARRMEVGKDLSRKEKVAQAKALLEEGEWKELGEGRKMGRNILADHICSQAKLFENMHDGINNSGGTKSGEGAWAYVATAIAEAKGVNPNSIYNKLYPETSDKQKHQLMQEALSEADRAYKVNPEISNCALANTIMDAYYDLCKDNNIELKPSSSESEGENPSRSRTFEWKYTRVPKEAFPKQTDLTNLQNAKNAMEKCNMEFPADKASELAELEKEARAWETEHNAEAELKQARSANYKEFIEQCDKLGEALTSIAKKADMLARAGEDGEKICAGLALGTEEEQEALEQLKNKAKGMAELKQVIDNLNK